MGRHKIARRWSCVSSGIPGKTKKTNRNPAWGDIMRGVSLNVKCNNEPAVTQCIALYHPCRGSSIFGCFPPGLHRCAASPPGYHISPLNRGSRFRSPPGCRTPSLPLPCGGNFAIRRADNFTVLLSTISRCAATFHCAERRNFSTNPSRAFFTQTAILA